MFELSWFCFQICSTINWKKKHSNSSRYNNNNHRIISLFANSIRLHWTILICTWLKVFFFPAFKLYLWKANICKSNRSSTSCILHTKYKKEIYFSTKSSILALFSIIYIDFVPFWIFHFHFALKKWKYPKFKIEKSQPYCRL